MEEKYFFDNDNNNNNGNQYPIYNYNNTGEIMIVNPFFLEVLLGVCTFYTIYSTYKIICNHRNRRRESGNQERLLENRINRIKKEEINFTNDLENKECSVCLEEFKENELLIKLECNHYFHGKCIHDWFKSNMNCPLCRLNLVI